MANDTSGVDLGHLRKHGQKLLFAFRTGWLDMANFLKDVEKNKYWKEWKFKSFREFYLDEYKLSDAEVKLLRVGIDTVTRFAPQILEAAPETREVPSLQVVQALAKAEKKVGREALEQVGQAVMKEDKPVSAKLAQIEAAVAAAPPLPKPPPKPRTPSQSMVRAVTSAKKLSEDIEQIEGVPKALREHAAALIAGLDELMAKQAAADEALAKAAAPAPAPATAA
jgi:hypothetical protein